MSYSRSHRPAAERLDASRTVRIISVKPGLPQHRPCVHPIPIEDVPARVSVRSSRGEPGHARGRERATEIVFLAPRIKNVELPHEPVVFEQTTLQGASAVGPAAWRFSVVTAQSPCATAETPTLALVPRRRSGGQSKRQRDDTFTRPMPAVLDGTDRISIIPHRRKGLTPRQIGDGEIAGHLNEARAAKGIIPESARLVAVFRRTPVELVSHMRFDESRKLLLFKLIPCGDLRCTRVYDLAAVRDLSTGKLHLIPHRTRYRTVSLS